MSIKLPRALERILAEPTWPGTLPRSLEKKNLGVDYDTAWARSPGGARPFGACTRATSPRR